MNVSFCAEEDYEHLQIQSNRLQVLAADHQQHVDKVSKSLAAWAEHQRSVHAHAQLEILNIAPESFFAGITTQCSHIRPSY